MLLSDNDTVIYGKVEGSLGEPYQREHEHFLNAPMKQDESVGGEVVLCEATLDIEM